MFKINKAEQITTLINLKKNADISVHTDVAEKVKQELYEKCWCVTPVEWGRADYSFVGDDKFTLFTIRLMEVYGAGLRSRGKVFRPEAVK